MEGKSNTGLYIGIAVVGVLGVVITIVLVSKKSDPYNYNTGLYPPGYNPALYPPGYIPPNQQTDKAALYTAGASVVNNVLSTFFAPKSSDSTSSASSSTKPTDAQWNSFENDIWNSDI